MIDRIRALADGELDPVDAQAVEHACAADPELASRLRLEVALRARVRETMLVGIPSAPAGLHERIVASLRADDQSPSQIDQADEPEGSEGDGATASPEPRARRSFWAGPQRISPLAVAASILLVVSAVLFGIYGKPIGVVEPDPGGLAVRDLAGFVAGAHHRLAMSRQSLAWSSPSEVEAGLAGLMGPGARFVDLDAKGYALLGGTPSVEGPTAAYLVYRKPGLAEDGCSASFLTVFVMPRDLDERIGAALPPIDAESWLAFDGVEGRHVHCAADVRFVYVVVCCSGSDTPALVRAIGSAP